MADPTSTPTTTSTPNAALIIDLCGGDDDPAAQYAKTMTESLSQNNSKRNRKRARCKDPPGAVGATAAGGADADAIEIDIGGYNAAAATQQQYPSVKYRQELGPIRFDFVDSFKGQHAYFRQAQGQQPATGTLQTNKLYKELLEYKLNLPIELSSSIFVRVCESRMDLIRALITGPEETPYANGCFLFDIGMANYPKKAPSVKFLTTGHGRVRFNPNLYNCGKVCLSLLGTWSGPGWQANQSTLLQVLVSIQGLILVPDPFYNEPGFERGRGKPDFIKRSDTYNRNIRKNTLQHGISDFLTQAIKSLQPEHPQQSLTDYPEYTSVVVKHFYERRDAIREQVDEWLAADVGLLSLAKSVRNNLDILEVLCAPPPPVPRGPPVVVTIDDPPPVAKVARVGPPEVVTIDDPPPLVANKGPPEVVTID